MANRMYSETPESRFVEAARTVIPSGVASDPPVDIEKIVANVVPDPVAGKILTAVKSEDGTTVMKWDDGVVFQDDDALSILAYIRLSNEFDVENYLDFLFTFDAAKFQEDFASEIEAWYERGFEQYTGQSIAYDLYMTLLTEMMLHTTNVLFNSYLITKKIYW